ncbi:hypothetical protein FNV43_RR09756 [Rhamnella rubrinervis]|uniref:SHSP domain-containing protein n=1 Tax=Rhamnella rubrinervis TaxID=2594499 RepID=A0A8K0MK94_9ROSA|nr:hypothetical protein FNV43_RR09756 [Rhamnella rubrinervis]
MSISRTSIIRGRSDPFFLDVWEPFHDFHFSAGTLAIPHLAFPNERTSLLKALIDWKETSETFFLEEDLPGIRKEDVKVQVEDGRVLRISSEKSTEKEEKKDEWHRVERRNGKFLRRIKLPENAKVDLLKATMYNGVLTVIVPKEKMNKYINIG